MSKVEFKNLKVIEKYGDIKTYENNDWTTSVMKAKWFDNEPTIEIRKINFTTGQYGAGVGMSEEEADKLIQLLLNNDFGSIEDLETALEKKKARFISVDEDEE